MPSPGQSTFDGNPNANPPTTVGYRPGPSDFNGAELEDDPVNPPDPETMPTSALLNTDSMQHVSVGKAMGCAGIGINAGSSPTVAWWWAAANLISANPFTVTRNAAGDYSMTWAANQFPVSGWPKPYLNALIGATICSIAAVNITNGVRVQTTQGGALADLSFSVDVF